MASPVIPPSEVRGLIEDNQFHDFVQKVVDGEDILVEPASLDPDYDPVKDEQEEQQLQLKEEQILGKGGLDSAVGSCSSDEDPSASQEEEEEEAQAGPGEDGDVADAQDDDEDEDDDDDDEGTELDEEELAADTQEAEEITAQGGKVLDVEVPKVMLAEAAKRFPPFWRTKSKLAQVKESEDSAAEDPDFVPLASDLVAEEEDDTDIGDESEKGEEEDMEEEQQPDNKEEEQDDVEFEVGEDELKDLASQMESFKIGGGGGDSEVSKMQEGGEEEEVNGEVAEMTPAESSVAAVVQAPSPIHVSIVEAIEEFDEAGYASADDPDFEAPTEAELLKAEEDGNDSDPSVCGDKDDEEGEDGEDEKMDE